MNKVTLLTLFPESFDFLRTYGVIGKAIENKKLELEIVDMRDFANNKHNHVDDTVYGGAAGMLIRPQVVYDALLSVKGANSKVAFMSATGRVLDQKLAIDFAQIDHLIIICGHYEGIDARIINHYVDFEISIGDYVLTGGEIPAMVLIDSMARFIDGVVGKEESLKTDSHYNILLQQDEYTKPRVFNGYHVPAVLLSGDHKKIAAWNKENAIKKTKRLRPDLYKKYLREESKDGSNQKNRK